MQAVPEPLLNNDGIVHLEKETGVGCCIYQFFPFSFRPLACLLWHGEGPFQAQQVVLCAWHHLKLVPVSGGLFTALPLRMFTDPKKTVLSHSLFMFFFCFVLFFCLGGEY